MSSEATTRSSSLQPLCLQDPEQPKKTPAMAEAQAVSREAPKEKQSALTSPPAASLKAPCMTPWPPAASAGSARAPPLAAARFLKPSPGQFAAVPQLPPNSSWQALIPAWTCRPLRVAASWLPAPAAAPPPELPGSEKGPQTVGPR